MIIANTKTDDNESVSLFEMSFMPRVTDANNIHIQKYSMQEMQKLQYNRRTLIALFVLRIHHFLFSAMYKPVWACYLAGVQ